VHASPQLLAKIIEQGIIDGEFKNSWNSKEFGLKTFAVIEGGILISRVSGTTARTFSIPNEPDRD
jgi:TetR/AcrR family transcriptional repressor of nem operon